MLIRRSTHFMMALPDHISESDGSEESATSMHDSDSDMELYPASLTSSHRFRELSATTQDNLNHHQSDSEDELVKPSLEITLPAPARPWEYMSITPSTTVEKILAEITKPGDELLYRIEYDDGLEDDVSDSDFLSACALLLSTIRPAVLF